jgi:hypothetical protein
MVGAEGRAQEPAIRLELRGSCNAKCLLLYAYAQRSAALPHSQILKLTWQMHKENAPQKAGLFLYAFAMSGIASVR